MLLLAFGFGTGLSPVAPGTAGAVIGLLAYAPLSAALAPWAHLLVVSAASLLGVWLCGAASRRLGGGDHPGIVWDEIVGCYLTCWLAPQGLLWLGLAFVAFRLFDIIKPWPIRAVDHGLRGGVGIMLDDMVAAASLLASARLLSMLT